MSIVEALVHDDIGVHTELRGGERITAGIGTEVLRWMESTLRPGMQTLETGCGLTTAVFAAAGTQHICISPFADEHRRMVDWCDGRGISTENVRFIDDRSDLVLPTLLDRELDVALIDGSHAFPHAFVDFWYTALTLKPEGLLIVDDLQLWTGAVLFDFLNQQPEWTLEQDWTPKTAAYRLTGSVDEMGAWTRQPYVFARSIDLSVSGLAGYWPLIRARRFKWAANRARVAVDRRIARLKG